VLLGLPLAFWWFLACAAAVVYTPVWAVSRPEFTAAVKAW
jgi:hypothetical protein